MEGASETPRQILFAAAWRGNEDKVKEIIDAKLVAVNAVDDNKVSALRFAAQFGHLEMVRFLLSRGAEVNLKARDGMTPLMAAVEQGHAEIVGVLLAAGANVNARAKDTNALLLAKEKGHGDLERVLIDAGATEDLGLWNTLGKKCSLS
jgi:serine/threonine-protein phosphatase 6 regulatory ankyrin repeat subunit B